MLIEMMDKRFESLIREMNARFEAVDKRFEAVDKRFGDLRVIMLWLAGLTTTSLLAIIGMFIKLLFFSS